MRAERFLFHHGEHDFGHDHGTHHHHHRVDEPSEQSVPEQTLALVGYMLEHNRAHAEEIRELAGKLDAMGQHEAAALIGEGVGCYIDGNGRLAEALEVMKGDEK